MIPNQNQFYRIVNKLDGFVADVYGDSKPGNKMVLSQWHGQDNQRLM
jgi:hypothetical protein